jgi:hypothetical protein
MRGRDRRNLDIWLGRGHYFGITRTRARWNFGITRGHHGRHVDILDGRDAG